MLESNSKHFPAKLAMDTGMAERHDWNHVNVCMQSAGREWGPLSIVTLTSFILFCSVCK